MNGLFKQEEACHHSGSGYHPKYLYERFSQVHFLMELGNEIGHGDIDEACRADCKERDKCLFEDSREQKDYDCSKNGGQRGKEIVPKGLLRPPSSMEEYCELPDFLGDLMENDCNRSRNPHRDADKEAHRDCHAVEQIVHGISEDGEVDHRMYAFLMTEMRLMPENESLKNEERQNTDEDIRPDCSSVMLRHDLRENMNKHVPEECTDRKTDEIGERLLQTLCFYGKREYTYE